MRINSVLVFLLFVILAYGKDFSQQIESKIIKDDLGNRIEITNVPKRVVTLAPNLTEMVFKLGEGEKLIANTTYCNFPQKAKTKIKVADLLSVDYEKLISLSPDLILMTVEGNSKISYDKLKRLGFKIFVSNPRNYSGIKKTFRDIAKIFDVKSKADSIIGGWDKAVEGIEANLKGTAKLKAMFVVSINPLMLAGENTFLNKYLKLCRLQNIAADSPANYPVFSREEILKRNPDVIILPKNNYDGKKELLSLFPEWKDINAVKNNKIYAISPDLFFRPGPRFVKALQVLYKKIWVSK